MFPFKLKKIPCIVLLVSVKKYVTLFFFYFLVIDPTQYITCYGHQKGLLVSHNIRVLVYLPQCTLTYFQT